MTQEVTLGTSKNLRYSPKAGPPSIDSRTLHFQDMNGDGHHIGANLFSRVLEKDMAPIIGGGHVPVVSGLTVAGWTVTTGGTGDAIANHTNGGLLLTAASDDNFDMTLDSVLAVTPTAGKWYSMVARLAVSNATGIGFKIGLTTGAGAAALPFGTNYTDVIGVSKAITAATPVGTVRGNNDTASDSSSLATVTTAEFEVGFAAYLHATNPAGYFTYKAATSSKPTVTLFSTAQLAQLALILTSPPTMYHTIHITGVTGTNPTLAVAGYIAGGDR